MDQNLTPNSTHSEPSPSQPPSNYGPSRDQEKSNTHALVGFILGIVGLIAWCLPFIGFPVAAAGIFFCILGLKSVERKTLAIIGLILSGLTFIATLINSIMGVLINTGVINLN